MSDVEMEGCAGEGGAAQAARRKKPTLQEIQVIQSILLAAERKIGKHTVAERLSEATGSALKAKVRI